MQQKAVSMRTKVKNHMKFFALQRLHNNFFLHLTVCPFDFLSVHPPTDKYFMTRLFSCLRRSPHLQLTFIARFYTQQEMLRHTHTHTHTHYSHLFSPPQREKPSHRPSLPQQKKIKTPTDVHWTLRYWETEEERSRGELKTRWLAKKKNLYFLNILQWFLFHHTDRPHVNPALHTQRAVCVHQHFHATSGHCCNASQIKSLAQSNTSYSL